MIREHFYLVALLLCVILISHLVQDGYYKSHQPDSADVAITENPDQFINNVNWLSWDQDGKPVNHLTANRLEHFPDKQGTILFQPRLTVNKTESETWLANAEKAWIPDSQQDISLENNVHVTLQSSTSTTLVTDQLTIDTIDNQAFTDSPVQIKSVRGEITSVGIHADFETGKIILQDKVRGKHDTFSR